MKLQILEATSDDLVVGFRFYEQSEHSIGDYFLTCLYSDIESLRIFGGIHRRIYKNLHRSLSKLTMDHHFADPLAQEIEN